MLAVPTLRFFILGPLRVTRDDVPCAPSAPMQRALLALLLLRRNQYVPTRAIVNELWSYCPPRSAVAALQLYVSAVRRRLLPNLGDSRCDFERHPVLRTLPAGYQLNVDVDRFDLDIFQSRTRAAQRELDAGRCGAASALFDEALAMWRGAALADVCDLSVLRHYAARLEEERLEAQQQRLWIDLRHGRASMAIGELVDLCASHPLRETLQCQLMIALALAGRRVDALEVYTRTYRALVDEVGLEPGHLLRSAQRALFAEDAASARDDRLVDLIPISNCGCA
jgi:DNA-binding SARP family transcriptional activator